MKKWVLMISLALLPSLSFADVTEDLEARGIGRGEIEKARMQIYENPQYKGLNAAVYYCNLLETKKEIDREIAAEKRSKGRSGLPSLSRIEQLDNDYYMVVGEIQEQKRLYYSAFSKRLQPKICKNVDNFSRQNDALHDELLLKAFAGRTTNSTKGL